VVKAYRELSSWHPRCDNPCLRLNRPLSERPRGYDSVALACRDLPEAECIGWTQDIFATEDCLTTIAGNIDRFYEEVVVSPASITFPAPTDCVCLFCF